MEALTESEGETMSVSSDMAGMQFNDQQLQHKLLAHLNTLRHGKQFCDVIFKVDNRDVPAHRVVLACTSTYLFELFSEEMAGQGSCQYIKLDHVDYSSFKILVNYAYTARLDVTEIQVKAVYRLAMLLKMDRAAAACSSFLVNRLSPASCLEIRSFASGFADGLLTSQTEKYIRDHMDAILKTPALHRLPRIQVDVIGIDEVVGDAERVMCQRVVDYLSTCASSDYGREKLMMTLCDNKHILYQNGESGLVDCSDTDDLALNNADFIRDYKKFCKHRKITPQKIKEGPQRSPVNQTLRQSSDRPLSYDREWRSITTTMVGEKHCSCLAVLGGMLSLVNVQLRPLPPSPAGSVDGEDGTTPERGNSPIPRVKSQHSLIPLATMSNPRCSVGTAVLNHKLIVLGGYDRGECLATVEEYDLTSNQWHPFDPMHSARGRFDACQVEGLLYACGGSDGYKDLRSAEVYDPASSTWSQLHDMTASRSSPGVAALNGRVYVVGGWSGYSGHRSCEVFDPTTQTWSRIAKMNTGRSQASVCALEGGLVAVGGCDAWNSMNSVERYDPVSDSWTLLPPMNTCRRGAGVAVFRGKLYVCGGSDGQQSLASTEIYDPHTNSWSFGPQQMVPRVNVGVGVIHNRLFAVGGFSGKTFLDTIEYLSEDGEDWCEFVPDLAPSPEQEFVDSSPQISAENGSRSTTNTDSEPSKEINHQNINGVVMSEDDKNNIIEMKIGEYQEEANELEQKCKVLNGTDVHKLKAVKCLSPKFNGVTSAACNFTKDSDNLDIYFENNINDVLTLEEEDLSDTIR